MGQALFSDRCYFLLTTLSGRYSQTHFTDEEIMNGFTASKW